jgi:flavin reductase (DIM6/NTAB) family NADH-FMN oxidoreductase RutF
MEVAQILDRMNRELWLLTSAAGEHRGGLIATFVCNASIVPELPRVLVGLAKQHFTWQLVDSSGAFALHLLGEEHLDWVWRFGLQSGRDLDKFAGLNLQTGQTGSPLLRDALGWLECRVEGAMDIGDRTVYLAEVVAGQFPNPKPVLTMSRLRELAPHDKLIQLRAALQRDAVVDAQAIRQWRQRR